MNTPASAVVPSREAAPIRRFKNRVTPHGDHLTESPDGDWVDYADHLIALGTLAVAHNTLLAEVERLTEENAKKDAAADEISTLAMKIIYERDAARTTVAQLERTVAALAASVSSASEEGGNG